jgi:DNA/RNA endonuclease YhcR with UshA esterase domain
MTTTKCLARTGALIATLLCITLAAPLASAHHSGALFYNMGARITLKGEVKRWNFRNPHAILELDVKNDKGEIEHWTCETSAPSALRRAGWSQDSIKAGEIVTIDGVPARDGSKLMRITGVTKADGTRIGTTGKTDD